MSAPASMLLRDLLTGVLSDSQCAHLPEVQIHELILDSRQVQPGSGFVAVPGLSTHGLKFAPAAIANGAVAVLWQPDATADASWSEISASSDLPSIAAGSVTVSHGVPWIAVPQLQDHLPLLAQRLYGDARELRIAAVTGTNGKSTTAYLLAQAAEHVGLPAGYIGTVGCGRVGALAPTSHTTADVLAVYRQLRDLRRQGAQVVAMEVSSHALHQRRIAGLGIDTAVFTNLTQDHLDYHGTMQAYGAAKAILFQWPDLRTRVINIDDDFGRELTRLPSSAHTLTYSSVGTADIHASVTLHDHGLTLDVRAANDRASLQSPLLGRFNAENLLAALGVLLAWGQSLKAAAMALSRCLAPPGRMELWSTARKRVVVDYAHTPDALQKALQVLKAHTRGRLLLVFGCGGDRDAGKRPQMGRIADQWADVVVLTNDNPRSEDPAQILAHIRSGMQRDCVIEPDRARAIALAVNQAGVDDVVLVAGKGHEDTQIIGNEIRHFSDREVVTELMRQAA